MNNKNEENKNSLQRAKKLSIKKDDEIIDEAEFLKFDTRNTEKEVKFELDLNQKEKEIKILDVIDDTKIEVDIPKKETNKNNKEVNLKDIRNIISSDIKESLSNSSNNVSKETINKLLNDIEKNKDLIFDKRIVNIFPTLKQSEVDMINKKMEEWNIPKEAQELNAEVIIAWLKNSKKNV